MLVAEPVSARERCPVCFADDWELDYVFTGEDEIPVENCGTCGWPPPTPYGVYEYRKKWLCVGDTPYSHPTPKTLRHIGVLLDLLDPEPDSE